MDDPEDDFDGIIIDDEITFSDEEKDNDDNVVAVSSSTTAVATEPRSTSRLPESEASASRSVRRKRIRSDDDEVQAPIIMPASPGKGRDVRSTFVYSFFVFQFIVSQLPPPFRKKSIKVNQLFWGTEEVFNNGDGL